MSSRYHGPAVTESATLRLCLRLLAIHPKVAWAHRMNSGKKAGVRFGFPGCPDILGQLRDGRVLAVEVKTPTGKTSKAQDHFLERCRRCGGVAGVVRSVSDLDALLR